MIVTPARGDSVCPGWSKPAGLKAKFSNSDTWSVRCGLRRGVVRRDEARLPRREHALRAADARRRGGGEHQRERERGRRIAFHDPCEPTLSSSSGYGRRRYQPQWVVHMDSLRGKLLLASPTMADPNFSRSVILIAEHTEEGAMGLVLNRPAETTVSEAVPDLAWLTPDDANVFVGGPVAETAVIVLAEFDRPELAGALVDDDLGFIGADADEPEQLDGAVRRARIFAGHAGWGPGQLEDELAEDAWIVEPPRREEVFTDDPEDLWASVLRRKGRRYALLSTMPPDPSLN